MSSDRTPAIDPEGFAALVEMIGPDMPEVVVEILDTYGEESAQLLATITDCAASGNVNEMLRPVHSLKSSSASVGALALSELCAELEKHLRGLGPVLDVDQSVQSIVVEHGRVQTELMTLRDQYASQQ